MIEIDLERLREVTSGCEVAFIAAANAPPSGANPRPEVPMATPAVGGISSTGFFHSWALAGLIILGGTPAVSGQIPEAKIDLRGIEVELNSPSALYSSECEVPPQNRSKRYSELRLQIIESGISLLGDDELRQEILDRRGEHS